ncbi:hypothetical protein [Nitriliruptor alkaliphilus]|uniref:hypothetical protein n=1 Tax=Nitriliruptor alkaliphilus TaxID=427918 RepID=UPI000696F0D9|nr:hypothetical protein [Nitriliruptor alkaliphilus]
MARITLDPEDVNQSVEVTLTDGRTVVLADADARLLRRVARQLHTHRSSYEAAFAPDDEATARRVADGEVPLAEVAPLHRRIAELLDAAAARGGRGPSAVDPVELLQTRTWTSSSGAVEQLDELTPTHRRNLRAWLERSSDGLRDRFDEADLTERQRGQVVDADPWVAGTPVYRRLAELIANESPLEQARDQARQVVRHLEYERQGRWPDR